MRSGAPPAGTGKALPWSGPEMTTSREGMDHLERQAFVSPRPAQEGLGVRVPFSPRPSRARGARKNASHVSGAGQARGAEKPSADARVAPVGGGRPEGEAWAPATFGA